MGYVQLKQLEMNIVSRLAEWWWSTDNVATKMNIRAAVHVVSSVYDSDVQDAMRNAFNEATSHNNWKPLGG